MNIKISELYGYCENIASTLGLSVNDKFLFDLSDETSHKSIEKTFKGIDKILLPQNGKYLVLMVSNEKPSILLGIFPETEAGDLKIELFNVKNQESFQVTDGLGTEEDPITLDNFEDALSSDEVEDKVNKFLFADEEDAGEGEPENKDDEPENKDDEPENKDDEPENKDDDEGDEGSEEDEPEDDGELTIVDDEDDDDDEAEDDETDDDSEVEIDDVSDAEVEIVDDPATAGDDNEEPADDETIEVDDDDDNDDEEVTEKHGDKNNRGWRKNQKPVKGQKVNEAEEPALAAPAAPAPEAPVDPAAPAAEVPAEPVIDDPSKNIRDLLKYYTDLLQKTSQDESASTEVVSGIQDIIANLVADLESINDLKEIENKEAKDLAKAAKELKKGEGEEVSEDGIPTEGVEGVTVPVDQEVTLKNPLLASEITPPCDINDGVKDVVLDPAPEAPAVADGIELPDEVTITDIPDDAEIDPSDEMALRGNIATVGPDGLPDSGEAPTDAQVDQEIASIQPAAEPEVPTADVDSITVVDDEPPPPAVDTTVDVPDTATPVVTDAPVDTKGNEIVTPASSDLDAKIDDELRGDIVKLGPDGLPVGKDIPSDEFIDDQIASLSEPATTDTGMSANGGVNFVPGDNAINWSDNLYGNGKANKEDNDSTVPAALQELKEYAQRLNKTVTECGDGHDEITIGRINKFCNLCKTAYDTWHKIQNAMNASNTLCEALKVDVVDECGQMAEDFEKPMECVTKIDDSYSVNESAAADKEFEEVQAYIQSIKKYL